jgi:hypothetical protein
MKKVLYCLFLVQHVLSTLPALKQASVVVRHGINAEGALKSVQKHGLLSFKELLRRGLRLDISINDIKEIEKKHFLVILILFISL